MRNTRGRTTPIPGAVGVTAPTIGKTRGRQRMSATRAGGTGNGTTVDQILNQWQTNGLIEPNDISNARRYVGLTLVTLGVTQ
jgi:hypothetical protein